MKTGIKTAAALTAILSAVMIADAHPENQQPEQQQRRERKPVCPQCHAPLQGNQGQFQRRQPNAQHGPQRQQAYGRQQQNYRPQYGPQNYRQPGPQSRRNQQFARPEQPYPQAREQHWQQPQAPRPQQQYDRQNAQQPRFRGQQQPQPQWQPTPEQKQKFQQRRQAVMKRFDADGDGRLSEQERKQAKKALKKHQLEGRQGCPEKRPNQPENEAQAE